MYFDSLDAVLAMDGHGAFVWSAYLLTAVVIAVMFIAPRRRQKRFLRQLAGELKRNSGVPAGTADLPAATGEDN